MLPIHQGITKYIVVTVTYISEMNDFADEILLTHRPLESGLFDLCKFHTIRTHSILTITIILFIVFLFL